MEIEEHVFLWRLGVFFWGMVALLIVLALVIGWLDSRADANEGQRARGNVDRAWLDSMGYDE